MKPTKSARQRAVANQNGFNLIEVLASTTIVAIVAGGLMASTITTIKSNAFSRDATTATSLAQDRIEQFRAMAPAQIAVLGNGSDTIASQAGNPQFLRQWVLAPGPSNGLRQVAVTVRWNAPEPRSVRAVAYLCRSSSC